MANKPEVIVHRAGGFLAPENTIEAMEIGLAYPVDGIEIDVLFTKDLVPIVYHDKSLKRTTKKRRIVRKVRYKDLKDLDNGSYYDESFSHVRISTLEQFLTQFSGRHKLYLEIKQLSDNLMAIPDLVESFGLSEQTTILSFHYKALLDIKDRYPLIRTMFLLGARWKKPLSYILDPRIDTYGLSFRLAQRKPTLLEQLINQGFLVNIWSCNDMELARSFIDKGVASITTDRPEELLQLIKSSLPR